ncbi:MAG: hypothetical protein ACLFXM_02420, partial [Acidimicrobiia bacterium]
DCIWTSEVDGPVLPGANLGPPPNPGAVLVFERCDDEWTGDIAWLSSDALTSRAAGHQRTLPTD